MPTRKEIACREEMASCDGFDKVIAMIGGKWKLWILRILVFGGTKRFNELRREITGITQTMLTGQLRALEADQLVTRKIYAEVPPRVEKFFGEMHKWAVENVAE